MDIKEIMEEYGLELADLRWYLCEKLAVRLLSYQDKPEELTRLLWEGSLDDELYEMEERFLEDIQQQINRETIDEPKVREIIGEVRLAKNKRRR